jgi:hypothetical protein
VLVGASGWCGGEWVGCREGLVDWLMFLDGIVGYDDDDEREGWEYTDMEQTAILCPPPPTPHMLLGVTVSVDFALSAFRSNDPVRVCLSTTPTRVDWSTVIGHSTPSFRTPRR